MRGTSLSLVACRSLNTSVQHLLNSIDALLGDWLRERGQGAYRARQIRHWLFTRRAADFGEMTDLAQSLRAELADAFTLWTTQVARHTRADDGTEKLLLTLTDAGQIECVQHP